MPDPYNLSAGRMIGTPYYSPRTSSALRRLAPVGDAELYGEDEEDAWLAREYLAANPNLTKATTRTARGSATINGKTYFMGPGGSATEVQDLSGGNDPAAVQAWASKNAPSYTWQDKPRYQAGKLMQSPGMMEWLKQRGEDRRFELETKREDMRSKRRRDDMEFEYGLRERSPEGRRALAEADMFGRQAQAAGAAMDRAGKRASVDPAVIEADATLAASPRAMEIYRTHAGTMDAPQALAQAKADVRAEADKVEQRLAALAQAAQRGDQRAAAKYQMEADDAKRKYGSLVMPPSAEVKATVSAAISGNQDLQAQLQVLRAQIKAHDAAKKNLDSTWFFDEGERTAARAAAEEATQTMSDLAAQLAADYGFDENEVYKALKLRVSGGAGLFNRVTGGR